MLKGPSENIAKNYHSERMAKTPLSDHKVELYVQSLFKVSARSSTKTAPAHEWFELLNMYNEREGQYILTQHQLNTIAPYCEANQDVEMTPEDFIRLLYLIRHDKIHQTPPPPPPVETQPKRSTTVAANTTTTASTAAAKKLLDSRPRSSRILSRQSYFSMHSHDDSNDMFGGRGSPNHPEFGNSRSYYESDDDSLNHSGNNTNLNHPDMVYNHGRRSDYHNNNGNNIHYSESSSNNNNNEDVVKELKKEKNLAIKQLREYEARMLTMSKEHTERIIKMKTRLEYMTIDAEQQKNEILEHKHKERERLDKIAELQALINEAEAQSTTSLKKHQKKAEELESVKEKLSSIKETQKITENKLHDLENELAQAREVIRALEKEKADLHVRIDREKRLNVDMKEELEEQHAENTKLLEIIDRQKFDLDEARSGLRYFTKSPQLDKKSLNVNNHTEEASLAQEQIEAMYLKKMAAVEKERDDLITSLKEKQVQYDKAISEYKSKLSNVEQELSESAETQSTQLETIKKLSLQFDQQHKVIDSITSTIRHISPASSTTSTTHKVTYYFLWFFFLFHLFQLSTFVFHHTNEFIRTPTYYLFQSFAESAYSKLAR